MSVRIVRSFQGEGPLLYVCSTPIGNLGDTSHRLLEVLRTVDVVAAEDTRQTRKLLTHFDIHPPLLISCHEHNQLARHKDFARWWGEGKRIALVSDAGTPLVSDPGDSVVQLAIDTGIPVIPVPGASAVLAALVGSGFSPQPFTFIGFLPREKRRAREVLEPYRGLPGTLVLYEAPHRLVQTLKWVAEVCPDRAVTVAKELTKRHETFYYADSCLEMLDHFAEETPRGEYVVILGPRRSTDVDSGQNVGVDGVLEGDQLMDYAVEHVHQLMREGIPHATAVKDVASHTGVRRKALYQRTLTTDTSSGGSETD